MPSRLNARRKMMKTINKVEGVDLKFSDDALEEIASVAYEKKLGARSLRKIIEDLMLEIEFNLSRDGSIKELFIDLPHVKNKEIIIDQLLSA